uniref:GDSL-type esterase/lipase family protein n=1 Tax=Prevotella sp. GTC17254 TaxID=3236794 RepID=A0AB33IXB6_9BACT
MRQKILLLLVLLTTFLSSIEARRPIKVACVGNSITFGYGIKDREHDSYPAQLQALLGTNYEVRNFGKSGATLINRAYRPYTAQAEYHQALDFKADMVIIHLGVNDTDPRAWPNYSDDFIKDYRALIDSFRVANPKCKVWICRLTPISDRHSRFKSGTRDWHQQIQKRIERIAKTANVGLIDLHAALYNRPDVLPDGLHPNAEGAGLIARKVYTAISGDMGGLHVSRLYTDGMVLQRQAPIHMEGTADSHDEVTIQLGKQTIKTHSNAEGHWNVDLLPMQAAKGLTLVIKTKKQKLQFNDVAIGEVWLCSGQSNMAFRTSQLTPTERQDMMDYSRRQPDIRLFNMTENWATTNSEWPTSALDSVNRLQYYTDKGWQACNEHTAPAFSAVGLAFARTLADSLGVTIGVICNAIGGSTTESWIPRQTLENDFPDILKEPAKNDFIQQWARERMSKNIALKTNPLQRHPYQPCYLFEAGIEPLAHYSIRGVAWYQGESNAHNMEAYDQLFTLMVDSWRNYWNSNLPFYYVQLSSLNRPSWPWFRDVQRRQLQTIANTGMAVSTDMGDSLDVHPTRKMAVGQRLARWALAKSYGHQLVPSGPLMKHVDYREGAAYVSFDYADGLKTADGKDLRTFEVAGEDGLYHPAQAQIAGRQVKVWSRQVAKPVAVRYGWQPYTRANLVNSSLLPASTFRDENF